MEKIKLRCGVYGDGSVLSVEIGRHAEVGKLQEAIFLKKRYDQRYKFDASELTLYLARKNGKTAWMKSDSTLKSFLKRGRQDDNDYKELIPGWPVDDKDYFGENFQPVLKEIHVLVELPEAQQSAATLAQLMPPVDQGATSQDLVRANWLTKMKTATPELLDKLFRVDNAEPCVDFCIEIGSRVVESVDPGDSFVSLWDDLICHVLNFVGIGKSDRNSSRSASTGPNRPDYLCIVDSVCVFRGEEKAPGEQIEAPRRELIEKLIWSYGEAPYLFGYAAVGYEVRLYAITRAQDAVDAVELGVFDVKHLEGRFRLLVEILNVARLFRSVASLCPESAREEYKILSRDQGIMLFLEPSRVVKCFPTALFQGAKDHVEAVDKMLEDHAVPNVDRLVHANQNAKRLVFQPRGQDKRPANLVELFHALAHVLQALAKLHAASWMHRDIRWSNVIKSREEENSWFLIDFMDAAQSPQVSPSGNHLSQGEHAPEIFRDGIHTTAVDVWSVGRLIQTCGAPVYESWYDTGRDRTQFLELLMHDDPLRRPTAIAALDRLRELEQNYRQRNKKAEIEVATELSLVQPT